MDERVWKALADKNRRHILDLLKEQRRTTGELCDAIPELDRCTVMKHLEVLVKAGLVVVERCGRTRYNYINHGPIHAVIERWVNGHTALLAQSAARLKRLSEGEKSAK